MSHFLVCVIIILLLYKKHLVTILKLVRRIRKTKIEICIDQYKPWWSIDINSHMENLLLVIILPKFNLLHNSTWIYFILGNDYEIGYVICTRNFAFIIPIFYDFILHCPLRLSHDLFGYFQYGNVNRNENILKSGNILLHIRKAE